MSLLRRWLLVSGGAALAFGLGAVACGGTNSLGGSVSELFPLDVSNVEVLRDPEAFQVSYYANHGQNLDLVARVTVDLTGVDFTPGKSIDLAGEYAPGHPRTTVVHLAAGEPLRGLPLIDQGDLHLDEGGVAGQETSGDFSMSFQQGDYGGGRNLYGKFTALAQDAGFGPDPFADAGTDGGP